MPLAPGPVLSALRRAHMIGSGEWEMPHRKILRIRVCCKVRGSRGFHRNCRHGDNKKKKKHLNTPQNLNTWTPIHPNITPMLTLDMQDIACRKVQRYEFCQPYRKVNKYDAGNIWFGNVVNNILETLCFAYLSIHKQDVICLILTLLWRENKVRSWVLFLIYLPPTYQGIMGPGN